jgi:hypothetical protein
MLPVKALSSVRPVYFKDRRLYMGKSLIYGGRYWDRTSDPCRVKAVLYR